MAASVGIGSGLVAGRQWGRGARGDMEAIDLGLAAATAGAVGIGTGVLAGRRTKRPAEGQSIDIVIIGAGVAGTLAAYRLAARYPTKSIAVFESRSRIGGRLWSVPVPPVENELAELGGMRTPFQHRATLDLIEELGLSTHPAPASAPSNFVRLRGTRMRRCEVTHAGQFPYQMRADLAALPPDSFFTRLAASVGLHDLSTVGGDETGDWLDGLSHHGTKLSFITAGELLEAEFGAEGAAFVQDWIGYELADLSASKWLGTFSRCPMPITWVSMAACSEYPSLWQIAPARPVWIFTSGGRPSPSWMTRIQQAGSPFTLASERNPVLALFALAPSSSLSLARPCEGSGSTVRFSSNPLC